MLIALLGLVAMSQGEAARNQFDGGAEGMVSPHEIPSTIPPRPQSTESYDFNQDIPTLAPRPLDQSSGFYDFNQDIPTLPPTQAPS